MANTQPYLGDKNYGEITKIFLNLNSSPQIDATTIDRKWRKFGKWAKSPASTGSKYI
jgi:hypothetical protein